MSNPGMITIRRPETNAEYVSLQDVQRRAWGVTDEAYIVPVASLTGANLHGGLVLGAYLPDGQAVGMSFAYLGKVGGKLTLYSQLTGVAPGYQGLEIGTRLKLAQRDFAVREGLEQIAWTFDPLQAGNARFNLAKLGARCTRYYVDMYGPRNDALNAGTPTDRLLAIWDVSPPPRARPGYAAGDESITVLAAIDVDGRLEPSVTDWPCDAKELLIEIPAEITALRRDDPGRALRWQMAVRASFQGAFRLRFVAVDFVDIRGQGPDCGAYVLRRPFS